jgi:tetratricopeptide (TPR) repeat protein
MPSIFISFSTSDGGDLAQHLYRHYKKKEYDVFYSTEEIPYGHQWPDEIKKNVQECDIFLVIATYGAIESDEVGKEIDEAKRLRKRIIPCRPNGMNWSDLEKLGVDLTQGPEFKNEYELVRKLDSQLRREFTSKSVYGSQNYEREEKTRLSTSSKYEHPSLGTEDNDEEEFKSLVNKGIDRAYNGRYEVAIKYFDRALEINPGSADVWMGKGFALNNLRKYKEAIECCDKAIEIKSDDTGPWNNKGFALNGLGRYKEAIECCDKAIELDPNNANAWKNKGIALEKLGKRNEAEKYYEKAREIGWKG